MTLRCLSEFLTDVGKHKFKISHIIVYLLDMQYISSPSTSMLVNCQERLQLAQNFPSLGYVHPP